MARPIHPSRKAKRPRGRPFPTAEFTERIWNHVMQHPDGVTITAISKGVELDRETVARYVDFLERQGEVRVFDVGNARLVRPAKS